MFAGVDRHGSPQRREPLSERVLRWPGEGYAELAPREPVVASQSVLLDDEQLRSFSAATVLQAFHRLGRELALRITGGEGLFVGYDRLELFQVEPPPARQLCIVAQAIDTTELARHRVCYAAYARLGGRRRHDRELDLLIAHAIGTTVVPGATGPARGADTKSGETSGYLSRARDPRRPA